MAALGGLWRFTATTIMGLLKTARPAAICRRVMAINVNSIDCCAREWLRSHVAKKCHRISAPCIAHGNTATSVILIIGAIGIVAAIDDVLPRAIFAGDLTALGVSVAHVASGNGFIVEAPTAARMAGCNVVGGHNARSAAGAAAPPIDLDSVAISSRHDGEAPELTPHHRDRARHSAILA